MERNIIDNSNYIFAKKHPRQGEKKYYMRAISINRAGDEFVCACRTCDEIRNRKKKKNCKQREIKLEPIAIVSANAIYVISSELKSNGS